MAQSRIGESSEGMSIHRPPFFDGLDYPYWKARMCVFLKSVDMDLWMVIERGPHKIEKMVDGQMVPKEYHEWTSEEKRLENLNCKAINTLHCSLSRSEYDYISTCANAQEIWNMLELKHEGTSQVKNTKINMLMHSYELFKMKKDESIRDMVGRLTCITNELDGLGRKIGTCDKVQKVLRSLPNTWRDKVTAIKEAKDLSTLKMEELIGSLMTHEIEMMGPNVEEDEAPRRRNLAMAVDSSSDEESSSGDEEMAMMMKHFKKFMKKGGSKGRTWSKGKSKEKSRREEPRPKKDSICFKCGKVGHFASECTRKPKEEERSKDRRKMKKKALKCTWDSSSSESSSGEDEDHKANLCMMVDDEYYSSDDEGSIHAHVCLMAENDDSSNDNESSSDDEVTTSTLTYDELLHNHNELCSMHEYVLKKMSKLVKKYERVKDDLSGRDVEYEAMRLRIDALEKENELLKDHSCVVDDDVDDELLSRKEIEFDELRSRLIMVNCDLEEKSESEKSLMSRVKDLEERNNDLEKQFTRFEISSKALQMFLDSQRHYFDKSGVGYDVLIHDDRIEKPMTFISAKDGRKQVVRVKLEQPKAPRPKSKRFTQKKVWNRKASSKDVWVPKGLAKDEMHAFLVSARVVHDGMPYVANPKDPKIWIPKFQ